ncbi:hypothetical protein OJ997_04835 [Solirubrobacter phytolaccae]|uniref:Uncharacterized protein n=1 Tax=Solirubrobacter phytolaccae TaxID=1404360 RepID=A0A9X3SDD3_9ACTN|nr:hypothetical protein [Solirubrobacter phytolaccae]MDA0179612.1 hypothetical protein [Solirubrobacter phytolaccae]
MSLDDTLRRADPITDSELAALPLDTFEAELRESILARPVRRRPTPPRRRLIPLAGALVASALTAFLLLLPGGGRDDRAWAAELVRVAESVPRLLVGDWKVTRADQFDVGMGEMDFTDGARTVQLSWRKGDPQPQKDGILAWEQDGYALELRGEASAEARAELRSVSVDEWLAAMPASVVQPSESDKVVDAMLEDMNPPPGFDRTALDFSGAPRDRYQLGAAVVAEVACGWIKLWVEGGEKERAEAVVELRKVQQSAVLAEMAKQGHYHEVLGQYVDALAGDGTVVGGKVLSVEESYKDALGC